MTAKEFFKSTAFKCIAVLLSIMLICGVLLTLCNALLYVSPEERTARAIAKVFPGEQVSYEEVPADEIDDGAANSANYAITQVFEMKETREGQYLLNVTGKNGYQSGTVTCWVLVKTAMDNAGNRQFTGVDRLVVTDNEKQSFIGKIGDDDIQAVIDKQNNAGFTDYDSSGISTGATFSLGAIANALNGAKNYVSAVYCGYVSPYEDYEYNDYIADDTAIAVDGSLVTYTIVTTPYSPAQSFTIEITVDETAAITAYEITVNGSVGTDRDDVPYEDKMSQTAKDLTGQTQATLEAMLSDGSLSTGATRSNTLCVYAALFATANYELALAEYSSPYEGYEYNDYIADDTAIAVDGSLVTYTIVTTPYSHAQSFTIEITVDETAAITAYEITVNGSVGTDRNDGIPYEDKMSQTAKDLTGQTQATLEAMLSDGSLSTGATKSNTLCVYAALFATANYELALAEYSEGGVQ